MGKELRRAVEKLKEKRQHKKRNKDKERRKGGGDAQFDALLVSLRLRVKEQDSDGNCLFRSIGDQLYGDSSQHRRIRCEVVTYMEQHRDHFGLFIEDDEDHNEYFARMRADGEWGGNLELYAAAELYQVFIVVYQTEGPCYTLTPTTRSDSSESSNPRPPQKQQRKSTAKKQGPPTQPSRSIAISYHGECHYNSVRALSDPDEFGQPAKETRTQGTWTTAEGSGSGERKGSTSGRQEGAGWEYDEGEGQGEVEVEVEANVLRSEPGAEVPGQAQRKGPEPEPEAEAETQAQGESESKGGSDDGNESVDADQPPSHHKTKDRNKDRAKEKAKERAAKELARMKARAAKVLSQAYAQAMLAKMSKKERRKLEKQEQDQQGQGQGQDPGQGQDRDCGGDGGVSLLTGGIATISI